MPAEKKQYGLTDQQMVGLSVAVKENIAYLVNAAVVEVE